MHRFRRSPVRDLSAAIGILAALAVIVALLDGGDTYTGPAYAVDGDTLEIAGTRIRLKGIDSPELHQSCTRDGRAWPCGEVARDRLETALRRGRVTCRASGRDVYERPLATCAVGDADLGAEMVRTGFALAYRDRGYQAMETEARTARRGIWAGSFQDPKEWRAAHPRT